MNTGFLSDKSDDSLSDQVSAALSPLSRLQIGEAYIVGYSIDTYVLSFRDV